MRHDLHKLRAAEIFGVPYEQVTDAQRKYAKMVNYIRYFSAPQTISRSLLIKLRSMKDAAQ